jgi:hypothetical protein
MNAGNLKRRRIKMQDAIFIYKKDNSYRVLNLDRSLQEAALEADGWKHVLTISASVWLEILFNMPSEDRELALNELLDEEVSDV